MSDFSEGARQLVSTTMDVIGTPMLFYFLVANTLLLLLSGLAIWDIRHNRRRRGYAGSQEMVSSRLAQGVSVVMPAFNEEAVIVSSVRAALGLRYPRHEVVVVDDGSTDATFERLRTSFDLVTVLTEIPSELPTRGRVIDVNVPRDGRTPLVVVRKERSGRQDANNVGIDVAAESLVAFLDADLILDPDALLEVTKPFADDPTRVVAAGGVIRVGNGCEVIDGRIGGVRLTRSWLVRVQIVEYLRAFVVGRSGWARLGALMLNNGAFGVFRRDILVEVGGFDSDCAGADFELVMRIHRQLTQRDREYSVHLVAGQVAWTEVPATVHALRVQRRRWHRGLWETLWKHRGMTLRPRFGMVGLVALPYFWAVELLSPLLELIGLSLVGTGLALGVVTAPYALMFIALVYGYGTLLTLVTLAVEEVAFHKYTRWGDLSAILLAAAAENLGYRQLTAWWRLSGLPASLLGRREILETRNRSGFLDDRLAASARATFGGDVAVAAVRSDA